LHISNVHAAIDINQEIKSEMQTNYIQDKYAYNAIAEYRTRNAWQTQI